MSEIQNKIAFNYRPYEDDIVVVGGKGRGKTRRVMSILSMIYQSVHYWVWDFNNMYGNFGQVVTNLDDLHKGQCIWQGDKSQETFDKFCEKAFNEQDNIVIVWEELHQYVSKQKIHQGLNSIVMTGRNYGISNIFVSTRPASLPNFILSNANFCFSYGLNNRGDIDWLKDYIGDMAEALFPKDKRKKISGVPMFDDVELDVHDCLFRNQLENDCHILRGYK